jgi:predicted RND superfamily exporter protein
VVIDRTEHPIQETARNLGPALLVVTFDAVFAFLALQFAKVPMLRDFGLLLAVGIATICIGSIILPLAILGIREFRSPTKSRDFRAGPLGRLVVWLGSIPARAAVLFAALSIGIFVAGISVENQLTLQTDPVQWVNQNSQTIKDIHEVERLAGGSSELGVYATSHDVFSDEFATFAHDFTQ